MIDKAFISYNTVQNMLHILYMRHLHIICHSVRWADTKMPTTKNIERQMGSIGDPISQENSTSGFNWDRIASKTK